MSDSEKKSSKKTKSSKEKSTEAMVTLNGKSYIAHKFRFKRELRYAKILAGIFKKMDIPLSAKDLKKAQDGDPGFKMSLNVSQILTMFADEAIEILLMGIGKDTPNEENLKLRKEIEEMEDTEEGIEALKKVLELNPMMDTLGKFTSLLGDTLST